MKTVRPVVSVVVLAASAAVASAIVFALRPRVVIIPTFSYLGVRKLHIVEAEEADR